MKKNKQSGAVLAISLMILLILTILTITSNRTVLMQEKMAEATYAGNLSLASAESAIRNAETEIETLTNLVDFNNTNGMYALAGLPTDVFDHPTLWTGTESITYNSVNGVTSRYAIENLGQMTVVDNDDTNMNMTGYGQTTGGGQVQAFRIVARSQGRSGTSERIVEVNYGKNL